MTFSINNGSLNSPPTINNMGCLEGKKSLLFLKTIVALGSPCCKSLSDYDWQSKVSGLSNRLNSLHEDPDSVENELRVLKSVEFSLASYTLREVFNAALSEATGVDQSSLAKSQEIHLNQIYAEQFLTWAQDEIEKLPQASILLLLTIYHAFGDLSICLNEDTWPKLLSLNEWDESQKKLVNQFKSKYEFLTSFSSSNFPRIKLENTINTLEPVGIEKLREQCVLWKKIIELLVKNLDEEEKKYLSESLTKSQTLLREAEKISDKDFISGFKQLVKRILPKLKQIKKSYDERIANNFTVLKLYKQHHSKRMAALQTSDTLQKLQKDIHATLEGMNAMGNALQMLLNKNPLEAEQAYKKLGKMADFSNQREPQASQNTQSQIKEDQLVERCKKEENSNFTLKKESISAVLFLSECLIGLLEKESQRLKQLEEEKRIAYEAAIRKSEGCYTLPPKMHKPPKKNLVERRTESDTEGSEEESPISSSSESSNTILWDFQPFSEINLYLTSLKEGKNTQINGFLSQAADSLLKTLKAHLLQVKAADDLEGLCDLQTQEIYDHLLLGTASLELIIQAVYDQRTDHIVLGFRAALLHCYYAMEQRLSQRIILETNKILDKVDQDHNLLHLAQTAKIADVEKWEQFLQEMTLHLAFSYPEDHRLFFQKGKEQKAFSLLDDLSRSKLDKKQIQKAIEFCFDMYSKSIAFITEVSSAQIEDQPKLLHVIQELKKQTTGKISLLQSVVQPKESDPMLVKIQQVLSILHPFLEGLNSYNSKWDKKIYTAIGTVQSYLKLIKISLEIAQNSNQHSLQKFIRLETIANVDKLFKHLFRVVILLKNGEDNHQHNLINLFDSAADFYKKNNAEAIHSHLKKINLGISHHYLHIAWNNSELHSIYNTSLVQAHALLNVSDEYTVVNKKTKKPAQYLQKNIDKINELVNQSLDLFMEFLEPTLKEIEKQFSTAAVT